MSRLMFRAAFGVLLAASVAATVLCPEAEAPTPPASQVHQRKEKERAAGPALFWEPLQQKYQGEAFPVTSFTESDVRLLAELLTAEAHVVMWNGTKHGVTPQARIAAVGWVALNRLDRRGGTLEGIIKAPHQFAWREGIEPNGRMLALAEDVLTRWKAEKNGAENAGRTIPAGYMFFHGDGRENHFREQYEKTGAFWDWSLPDPYGAG